MTEIETEGTVTLEEQIHEVSELIETFVEGIIEKNKDFDPINNDVINFDIFKHHNINNGIKTESLKNLIVELSLSRVLSNFIDLKTSENDYNLKQIATLIDVSFYLKKNGDSHYDLPYELIKCVIKETSVDWLLKFWNYFNMRIELIKNTKDDEVLQTTKHPGADFIITLNIMLKRYEYNNEPKREELKSNILILTSKLFPISDKHLINKSFNFNNERINEIKFNCKQIRSNFKKFWNLQYFFIDPIKKLDNDSKFQMFLREVDDVYQMIYEIENKENGPLNGGPSSKEKFRDAGSDNTLKNYIKSNLTKSKIEEIKNFYFKKEFNPSFYINETKFDEQITKDQTLRRVVLFQLYFFTCSMISLVNDTDIINNKKYENKPIYGFVKIIQRKEKQLNQLKRDIQFIFQSLDKRIFFANQQMASSEITFLQLKIQQFKEFGENIYQECKVDDDKDYDELISIFNKYGEFKKKFWAQYGTPAITKHWKIPTGLKLLVKDNGEGTSFERINQELGKLRNEIKNSTDMDVNNLNSWKALRLARKIHLFKFKHVNESTGVEGLFDPSLKEEDDKKRQIEELGRIEMETKRKEEEILELERKRKMSEDAFVQESKRAKLESSHSHSQSQSNGGVGVGVGVDDTGAEDLDY